jgi:uncharacterized iron-regulated membrane protein
MALHMAMVFGFPMKTFVSLMGLTRATVTVTGVIIWWRKRRARRRFASVRAIWDIVFAKPDHHPKGLMAVEHQRVALLGNSLSLRAEMLGRTL